MMSNKDLVNKWFNNITCFSSLFSFDLFFSHVLICSLKSVPLTHTGGREEVEDVGVWAENVSFSSLFSSSSVCYFSGFPTCF